MKDFPAGGQETGHDHFFAALGKFGAVAGAHIGDSIADLAQRAASENQLYVETAFNLGVNMGALAAKLSSGTLTANSLPGLYADVLSDPGFDAALTNDIARVALARTQYRATLGCSAPNPPAACDVGLRFIAQVSRTGAAAQSFGQLLGAFEIAAVAPELVGVELASPEDATASLNNYSLHMQMLDFLYEKYTVTGSSPLHVTL